MKILLTGGTGYIGSHTAIELINSGYTVELLDNLHNSKSEVIDKIEQITKVHPVLHQIDLLDQSALNQLFTSNNFDACIHFAGLKAVAESINRPLLYYRTNLISTLNLLEACQTHKIKHFVFSSSATVYGANDTACFTEDSPVGQNITNPYGQTKYMIEQILRDFSVANPDYNITILRYFNPVGAHPSGLIGENPNDIPNNLMPIIMKVYTGELTELSIYGNDYNTPDGTCMRDFIHVVDLAKGHVAALKHSHLGVSTYNLGTGRPTSVMEMVAAFEKISGQPLPHKIAPRRPGDIAVCYADPTKANRDLGWSAELTTNDAIKDTLHYLSTTKTT